MDHAPAQHAVHPHAASPNRWFLFFRRTWHLWVLLGLTILGGGLRFFRLDHPFLWFDEAATFGRVAGDYDQMMKLLLKYDGFMPLHYMTYWWLGQHTTLTPFMLRLIPAITGTLMIPAMYFLARQMTSRPAALLAAAFTACSAYLLAFSRDAKMYMHTWFFVALSAALLLWWIRSRNKWVWLIGWPLWVLTNMAAVWLSANALFVLALQPLWVLLGLRGPWRRILLILILFLAGLLAIAYGPYQYYQEHNRWFQRSGGVFSSTVFSDDDNQSNPNWAHSGINWIPRFHGQRTGPELALHTASSFILGWEWPSTRELQEKHFSQEYAIPRWTIDLFANVMILTGLALAIGALPWHRRLRTHTLEISKTPWWLATLWLSIWILLPTYSFYCRSVPDFSSPRVVTDFLFHLWGWWWLALALGMVGITVLLAWSRAAVILLTWLLVTIGLISLKGSLDAQGISHWLADWLGRLGQPWILGIITLAGPPLVFQCSGATIRQRLIRSGQLFVVLGLLWALAWVTYLVWYDLWLLTQQKAPIWLWFLNVPEKPVPWMNLWWPRYLGVIWPAIAIALAVLIWRLPTWPLRWAVILILLGVNLGHGMARVVLDTEPPVPTIAADLWVAQQPNAASYVVGYDVDPQGRWGRPWPVDRLLRTSEGRYYVCMIAGITPQPKEFRSKQMDRYIRPLPRLPISQLPIELSQRPQVRELVIWLRYPPAPQPASSNSDPFLSNLGLNTPGSRWYLAASQTQRVRQHWSRISREWNWQQREWIERRVYQLADPGTPDPGTPDPGTPGPGTTQPSSGR